MIAQDRAPEKITGIGTYVAVYASLLILTVATTLIALLDLGPWSMVIALAIAAVKALLVVLFFMDALHNHRLNPALLFVGFIWLCILILLTMSDYVTRGWIPFPGR